MIAIATQTVKFTALDKLRQRGNEARKSIQSAETEIARDAATRLHDKLQQDFIVQVCNLSSEDMDAYVAWNARNR